ncbi:MAG TPA: PIN domain-containing protein [Phycisphaerales bacterium]|nr:PIN domain-containing protein [Phycisphaerales bacterium]
MSSEHAPLVTSDWVLAEFLNSIARDSDLRGAGARIVERLHLSSRVVVVEATREGWRAAFDLYRSRADKGCSLVDCSSILICQSRGIRRVFTRDGHFEQAGLEPTL